jgi:hypothetical protein
MRCEKWLVWRMGIGIHGIVLLRAEFGTITVVQSTAIIFLDGRFGLFGPLDFRDSLAQRWPLLTGVRLVMKTMMNKKVVKP